MSELAKRVITAILFAPTVLFLTWYADPRPFFIFLILVITISWWEIMTMKSVETPFLFVFGGWIVFIVNLYLFFTQQFQFLPFFWAVSSVVALVSLLVLIEPERGKRVFNRFLVGIIYLGFLLPFILLLKINNSSWALLALILTWFFDSGSYFIGKAIGKHTFLPRVSPKKSWEGFIGGVVTVIIATLIIAPFFGVDNLLLKLLMAFITAFLAALGDLSESFIKRAYRVKDSSSLLPGHGGFLDRIDSLCFVFLGFYILFTFGGNLFN